MRWVGCFGQTFSTWASIALGCRALHTLLYLFLEDASSDFIIKRREIGVELPGLANIFFQKRRPYSSSNFSADSAHFWIVSNVLTALRVLCVVKCEAFGGNTAGVVGRDFGKPTFARENLL